MGSNSISRVPGRKLTVAHFMPWSGMGGVEVATLRMANVMGREFRNIAFCLDDAVELRGAFEKSGIETVTYTPPEPSLRHAGRFYQESRAVANRIRSAGADIVHFADEKAAYHNSFAALLARTRIICHLRSTYSQLSLRQRLCFWPIHGFIFVSKESRQSLAQYLPDSKTRVIYDAVEVPGVDIAESNTAVRRELGVSSSCTLVGMVARVAPVKDYYTLAYAAAEVLGKHPDTRFLIVGDHSLVDQNRRHYIEIVQKLKELGIESQFIFTGYRSDVSRLIAAMNLCVLCTHREGFPLSILESMALGKPVIATEVGGIPEIIQHGVTGYLHRPGNSKELTDAIMSLIEDPEKAKRFGVAGYENVQQNFSPQRFAVEISRAYSDVMCR